METELNNTGIKLADLNETEIKLAIELYKLADPVLTNLAMGKNSKYIGIYHCELNFWAGNGIDGIKPITLHQLAFESDLNPDWADEIIHAGANLFWYGDEKGKPFSTGMGSHGNSDILIKKQTETKETELKPQNNYEFVMNCKRTGQPFIADVYSILKALPNRLSPEVEHSVKKLLSSGNRNGGKSYRQDIEEARNQLNQELDYLDRV